jgi:hypothetical protein
VVVADPSAGAVAPLVAGAACQLRADKKRRNALSNPQTPCPIGFGVYRTG